MADIKITRSGTLFLFEPKSAEGKAWLDKNVDAESNVIGETVVVEHRFAFDIAKGAIEEGLEVE